jgi:hypothetical protein
VKRTEERRASLAAGLERQQESIQKMEKALSGLDYSPAFFEGLRGRFFSQADGSAEEEREDREDREGSEGAWLDGRSHESYQQLVSEVKLYRKLDHDYELKIGLLAREQQEAEQRNLKSRNRLLEIEYVPLSPSSKSSRPRPLPSSSRPRSIPGPSSPPRWT